ncbi:hypothetical protein [Streptomyces tendae]|uniref:hypothetical protein n=1 Tax=Streptomyces tendae TaxID=1932 RepID=UPI003D74CCC0
MPKLTDDFLKMIADEYRELVAAGSQRPNADLAERYDAPAATVRRWVANARQRGFLPPGTVGRATIEGTADPLRPAKLVGLNVRRFRILAGMTQQQLGTAIAQQTGANDWFRQSVHQAERGKRSWAAADVVAAARVLGVAPGQLFEEPTD